MRNMNNEEKPRGIKTSRKQKGGKNENDMYIISINIYEKEKEHTTQST